MIKLILTSSHSEFLEQDITPTMFPDGTSQVWHLEDIDGLDASLVSYEILWRFENEAELIHVAQLKSLLDQVVQGLKINVIKILNIPFLPYGRQDHNIENQSTFAQHTFSNIINGLHFDRVLSFDPHGKTDLLNFFASTATKVIEGVFIAGNYDLYFFPDAGAYRRYCFSTSGKQIRYTKCFYGNKKRDQSTGEIIGYEIVRDTKFCSVPEGKKILIVDDICDGGKTFIEAAKLLLEKEKVSEIGLYVSHGIFSKGKHVLKEAGISHIYTTNSLAKNKDGIPV